MPWMTIDALSEFEFWIDGLRREVRWRTSGQLGTFVLPEWRHRGVAQQFYRRLGCEPCGRLARLVVIDGIEDDEIIMELFVSCDRPRRETDA